MSDAEDTAGSAPTEKTLLEIYRAQWADMHHSRNQDWELSKIIFVGAIGLSGIKMLDGNKTLQAIVSIALALISLFAVAITVRHRALFSEKMHAIRVLERHLKVDNLNLFPSKPKSLWNSIGTQHLLIAIYFLAAVVFLVFSIAALR